MDWPNKNEVSKNDDENDGRYDVIKLWTSENLKKAPKFIKKIELILQDVLQVTNLKGKMIVLQKALFKVW